MRTTPDSEEIGEKPDVDMLLAELRWSDGRPEAAEPTQRRARAAAALVGVTDPRVDEALLEAMEQDVPAVRAAAVEALRPTPDARIIDALSRAALGWHLDSLQRARRTALQRLESLARTAPELVIDRFVTVFLTVESTASRAEESGVVQRVARATSPDGRDRMMRTAARALVADAVWEARARRLLSVFPATSLEVLTPALDHAVYHAPVSRALGEGGDVCAIPCLMELLRSPSADGRMSAAIALGEIGDPRPTRELTRLLGDPDALVQDAAGKALDRIEAAGLVLAASVPPPARPARQRVARASAMRRVRAPRVRAPRLPEIRAPRMPKISGPRLPEVRAPRMPKITGPRLAGLRAPRMPKMGAPGLPKVSLPRVRAPRLPRIHVSGVVGRRLAFGAIGVLLLLGAVAAVTAALSGKNADTSALASHAATPAATTTVVDTAAEAKRAERERAREEARLAAAKKQANAAAARRQRAARRAAARRAAVRRAAARRAAARRRAGSRVAVVPAAAAPAATPRATPIPAPVVVRPAPPVHRTPTPAATPDLDSFGVGYGNTGSGGHRGSGD
jgi:HEAT repeat protein